MNGLVTCKQQLAFQALKSADPKHGPQHTYQSAAREALGPVRLLQRRGRPLMASLAQLNPDRPLRPPVDRHLGGVRGDHSAWAHKGVSLGGNYSTITISERSPLSCMSNPRVCHRSCCIRGRVVKIPANAAVET